RVASVPLIPKFVLEYASRAYELRNRDTSLRRANEKNNAPTIRMGKRALSGGSFGRSLACALAVLALSAASARAQMSANPLEVGQKIEALGRAFGPEIAAATAALYIPLQERKPY